MKKYIILIVYVLSFEVYGVEIPLIKVVNEADANSVHTISIDINSEGEILGLTRKWGSGKENYNFKKIQDGLVIFKAENKEVLFLECANCDSFSGGEIMFKYLENGIFDKYAEIYFDLSQRNGKWGFYRTHGGSLVKEITLKPNKMLGKIIGIKDILISP